MLSFVTWRAQHAQIVKPLVRHTLVRDVMYFQVRVGSAPLTPPFCKDQRRFAQHRPRRRVEVRLVRHAFEFAPAHTEPTFNGTVEGFTPALPLPCLYKPGNPRLERRLCHMIPFVMAFT